VAPGKERPSKFVLERNGSFKPPADIAFVFGARQSIPILAVSGAESLGRQILQVHW
jgi:hypothetical protein